MRGFHLFFDDTPPDEKHWNGPLVPVCEKWGGKEGTFWLRMRSRQHS